MAWYNPASWLPSKRDSTDSRFGYPDQHETRGEKIKSLVEMPSILPFFDPLQNQNETPVMRRAYRVMLSSPIVKSALMPKIFNVARQKLEIHPASDKQRDKDIADFQTWQWTKRLKGGMIELVWNILLHASVDGTSVNEKVTDIQKEGKYKNKEIIRELKPKDVDQDLYLWLDAYRNITAVQGLRWNSGEMWDPEDFIIYKLNPMWGNLGISDLRSVYMAFWSLDTVEKLRTMGAEKRAFPAIAAEYSSVTNQKSVEGVLARLKFSNWLAVPAGTKITMLDLAGHSAEYFSQFRRDKVEEIYQGIQYAFLQAITGGKGQIRGSANVAQTRSQAGEWFLAQELANILNDHENGLIKWSVDKNFMGVTEYPWATISAIEVSELEAWARVLKEVQGIGYHPSKQFVRDKLGIPEADSIDDILMPMESTVGQTADQTNDDEDVDSLMEPGHQDLMSFGEQLRNGVGKDRPGTNGKSPKLGASANGNGKVGHSTPGVASDPFPRLTTKADEVARKLLATSVLGRGTVALRNRVRKVYSALEARDGKKQALATFAVGVVTGWKSQLHSQALPTKKAMVPYAAIAETYLWARKGKLNFAERFAEFDTSKHPHNPKGHGGGQFARKGGSSEGGGEDPFAETGGLDPENVKSLGEQLVDKVSEAWAKKLNMQIEAKKGKPIEPGRKDMEKYLLENTDFEQSDLDDMDDKELKGNWTTRQPVGGGKSSKAEKSAERQKMEKHLLANSDFDQKDLDEMDDKELKSNYTIRQPIETPAKRTVHESIMHHFNDLLEKEHKDSGLVPIHKVRARIEKEHGKEEASHEQLDEKLFDLWRKKKLGIAELSAQMSVMGSKPITDEEVAGGIPGKEVPGWGPKGSIGTRKEHDLFYLEKPINPEEQAKSALDGYGGGKTSDRNKAIKELSQYGPTSNDTDPHKLRGFNLKPHEATAKAIEQAVQKQKQDNPYQRLDIGKLLEKHPMPVRQMHGILVAMQDAGRIRLGAHTQAVATHEAPEKLLPLDREHKWFVEPAPKR
jgi:hypothetical protein